jgi:hypothetical protein
MSRIGKTAGKLDGKKWMLWIQIFYAEPFILLPVPIRNAAVTRSGICPDRRDKINQSSIFLEQNELINSEDKYLNHIW